MSLFVVAIIIVVALVFDFFNGFNDAANSIATIVATKVLTPLRAVVWAAFWNFVAAFAFGVPVAKTVGGGVVHKELVTPDIVLAGLCGAILWTVVTSLVGLPISCSHALIGGFAGAALTAVHIRTGSVCGVLNWQKLDTIALYKVLSPVLGMALGFLNMLIVMWLFRRAAPHRVDSWFRRLQLLSAAAYSLGHGTNDAQKTMGIITILLYSAGMLRTFEVPFWVVLTCHAAIAMGTISGGWRVIKTMGISITKLRPVGGFCAETAGAATIIGASLAGIPVSTTHTITGAIVGVGATHRLSAVRWGVAGRIVWAWVLTMPASGLVGAGVYVIIHALR